MLHVCSIFVFVSLILIEKSTDKALFCLYEKYLFYLCYLFDLELVLKFQFNFVI